MNPCASLGPYFSAKLGRYEFHVRQYQHRKGTEKKKSPTTSSLRDNQQCKPNASVDKSEDSGNTRRERKDSDPETLLESCQHQFKCKSGEASYQFLLFCGIRSVCRFADFH